MPRWVVPLAVIAVLGLPFAAHEVLDVIQGRCDRQTLGVTKPHTEFAEAESVVIRYYQALQRCDFSAARAQKMGSTDDGYPDGYRDNLRQLRAFNVHGASSMDDDPLASGLFDAADFEVELDVRWKKVITTRNGTVIRFVSVGRATPTGPLRIFGEGSGP